MNFKQLHRWPTNEKEAIRIQEKLRDKIVVTDALPEINLIAGVDTAFNYQTDDLYAVVSVYSYPQLELIEQAAARRKAVFQYIPGLHAFREGAVILEAFTRVRHIPDVIIFAGHGIAHPRQFGLASHLGLILDRPALGCARKKLVGHYQGVGPEAGESSPLYADGSICGIVYRSRTKVKPIFISPGYKCNLKSALKLVKKCLRGYRIPEPLRSAHILAGRTKRADVKYGAGAI